MPEEPEVETERVREVVAEELERDRKGAGLLKQIALTTAILAAVAAVAALQSGSAVNTALILKTEATRLQAEASDQWAYYQAKGIKAAIQEAARGAWLAAGKQPPAVHEAETRRHAQGRTRSLARPTTRGFCAVYWPIGVDRMMRGSGHRFHPGRSSRRGSWPGTAGGIPRRSRTPGCRRFPW